MGALYKKERGQALVEFALIVPILFLLIFGIIEFGRIYSAHLTANHSAREGVRAAAVGATDSEIISIVQNRAAALNTSKLNINISPQQSYRYRGESVSVSVTYPVQIFTPVISSFFNGQYQVSVQVTMRVE
jgi:Flp pilus assembly protein TadG